MYEPTTKSNPTSGPAAVASLQFAIKHLVLSIKIVGHSFALLLDGGIHSLSLRLLLAEQQKHNSNNKGSNYIIRTSSS